MVEERMSRAGWTYGQLVDDIFEGRWAAEETVSAYSLASRLGVSRTPVVEALKRLEAEGIVEIVPKVGCRLARRDPESLDELLSVAGALEGLAAERAAERADGAQLRRMGGVVDGLAEAAASDDGAAFAQLERQFHRQLTAAGLPRLDSAADGVWLSLRAALGPQVSRQSRQHIATGRRGILEALRLRDSARARAAAERHIAALAGDARNGAAGDCAALGNALGGLEHSALLYGSEAEFVASALPFALTGVQKGERVLVVSSQHNIDVLSQTLGSDGAKVDFWESSAWYTDPGSALRGYQRYIGEHGTASRVRVVGEPPWRDRDEDAIRDWLRYESVINVALELAPASIMCPYDTERLAPVILEGARSAHPHLCTHGQVAPSGDYRQFFAPASS
ncbi:MAG: FCD domain-containing protein [Actinobacteria bacterium]|nr:MAG: FCD domain-containing protein [Actinomycetota bacterium]